MAQGLWLRAYGIEGLTAIRGSGQRPGLPPSLKPDEALSQARP
jgi:hypothetical protein